MSRIALTSRDMTMKRVRRAYVPVGSTVLAILLALLPVIVTTPLIPDFGYLFLLEIAALNGRAALGGAPVDAVAIV
jgi:uncharacterized membrane protein